MIHLDTFSGIGGWALASRWMGWQTAAFVERDKFCQKVLAKNFPGVPIYDDVTTFSGKPFRDRIGILTGSTPCQPFSQAGKREGSNDERHLFPEFLRLVDEIRPRWVVIENVYGLINIESGQVFEDYHASLEGQGYAVQTVCIPASSLGAPHRRDRLWIIANSVGGGRGTERITGSVGTVQQGRQNDAMPIAESDSYGTASDAEITERKRSGTSRTRRDGFANNSGWDEPWISVAARTCVRGISHGLSDELHITGSRDNRVNRLKALGNAIVPQVAFEIFKAIEAAK